MLLYSRRYADLPETKYFQILTLLILIWVLLESVDISLTEVGEKVFLMKLKFLVTPFIGIALFGLLASHSGKESWLTRRNLTLLCVVPFITVAMAFTVEYQQLFLYDFRVSAAGPIYVLENAYGPWMNIYLIYTYGVMLASVLLLIGSARGANPLYRGQVAIMFTAILIPAAFDVLSNYAPTLVNGEYLAPASFALSGAVMAWGLYRYRILDVRPIARSEMVENMTDILLVADLNDRLIDRNRAAGEALKDYGSNDLGTPVLEAFPFDQEFVRRFREQDAFKVEVTLGKGEDRRTYEASVMPVVVKGEKRARMVLMRDMTERKRIEEALQVANRKLGLLSSITRHDLLNKLTAMDGYLALAFREGDRVKAEGYLSKCQRTSGAARSLIQFTKNYEGLGVLAPNWYGVRELFRKAAANLNLDNVRVNVSVGDLSIYGDAMMEKVFLNLIDNSLKYGEKVTAIQLTYQVQDDRLLLVYQDDGMGIPMEDKSKIFERGFGKNTGLGLFLARDILAITNIEIAERGEPGKGARFELSVLPGAYRFDA